MKKLFLSALLFSASFEFAATAYAGATQTVSQVTFEVAMSCPPCERYISRTLSAVPGVISVNASFKDKRVAISYDPAKVSEATLKAKIAALGYDVKLPS